MGITTLTGLTLMFSVVVLAEPLLGGKVTDTDGTGIPGAVVRVHWDPTGSGVGLSSNVGIREDIVVTARADGTFSVDLPPGFYDVFVSSPAFTPLCRKVRIWNKKITFDARLPVDALVGDELGMRVTAK